MAKYNFKFHLGRDLSLTQLEELEAALVAQIEDLSLKDHWFEVEIVPEKIVDMKTRKLT